MQRDLLKHGAGTQFDNGADSAIAEDVQVLHQDRPHDDRGSLVESFRAVNC